MNRNLFRTGFIIVTGLLVLLMVVMGTAIKNGNWDGIIAPRVLESNSIAKENIKIEPLSISDTEAAIEAYLDNFENKNLEIGEIMVFDNQAYARIIESDTGLSAFELIVDPSTQFVYHAQGPNVLWNVKYGSLRGGGIGESVMIDGVLTVGGSYLYYDEGFTTIDFYEDGVDKPIDNEQALLIAEEYLVKTEEGLSVEEDAKEFYGYYTFHTTKDGNLFGLISVNGYTGQVFIHTWHGQFIEMQEYPITN